MPRLKCGFFCECKFEEMFLMLDSLIPINVFVDISLLRAFVATFDLTSVPPDEPRAMKTQRRLVYWVGSLHVPR